MEFLESSQERSIKSDLALRDRDIYREILLPLCLVDEEVHEERKEYWISLSIFPPPPRLVSVVHLVAPEVTATRERNFVVLSQLKPLSFLLNQH